MVKHLVIFGTGSNAEMAYDYFKHESDYEVVAFTIEREYLGKHGSTFFQGLPVVSFEFVEGHYSPRSYEMFIAVGYLKLNQVRARIYTKAKEKGYRLATFISPDAYIGRNVQIGDNCFIMEYNNLQYGVKVDNNSWLWAKNHIGHHTKIGKHCFLASGITISGYCDIGDYTFIGSGVSTADNIKMADNTFLKVGTIVKR
ncbi:MAG: acetyltransferase, partial [Candidatus Hodarchaeales archaeon]